MHYGWEFIIVGKHRMRPISVGLSHCGSRIKM